MLVDTDAALFVTRPHTQGLTLHRDDADAFVLQLSGSKQWRVHGCPADGEWQTGAVTDDAPLLLGRQPTSLSSFTRSAPNTCTRHCKACSLSVRSRRPRSRGHQARNSPRNWRSSTGSPRRCASPTRPCWRCLIRPRRRPGREAAGPSGLPADHGGVRRGRRPAVGTGGLRGDGSGDRAQQRQQRPAEAEAAGRTRNLDRVQAGVVHPATV